MKQYLARLFDYNQWANDSIAVVLSESDNAECLKFLGHIVAAQDIWLRRLLGKDYSGIDVWPVLEPLDCVAVVRSSCEAWQHFILERTDLEIQGECSYTDIKGTVCSMIEADAMMHVINHSTHHRAQIAFLLRKGGSEPPATDYTYFSRKESR